MYGVFPRTALPASLAPIADIHLVERHTIDIHPARGQDVAVQQRRLMDVRPRARKLREDGLEGAEVACAVEPSAPNARARFGVVDDASEHVEIISGHEVRMRPDGER